MRAPSPRSCCRTLLALLAFAAPAARADIHHTELRPFARLAGSCWKGSFPGGATDEHCYEWAFGGWAVRDRHVVRGGPAPYSGETIYRWDPLTHRIVFDYWNADGDHTTGWAEDRGDSVVFHESLGAGARVFRTVWRLGADAYTVATAESAGGAWRDVFTMDLSRSRATPEGALEDDTPDLGAARAAADSLARAGWRIAYNAYDRATGEYEVWIMDADGSNRRNLTNSPGTDWVYTARAGRLYFVSRRGMTERGYHLYSMKPDGTDVRRISRDPVPDSFVDARRGGAEVVIASMRDGQSDLVVVDREGRDRRVLTHDGLSDLDPAVSPDGRKIAWRHGPRRREEVWVMNADGSGRRALTSYPAADSTPSVHVYRAGPPRWSPDGAWISYASHRRGHHDLWVVAAQGGEPRRVTRSPADECWHDWAPDGGWLVTDVSVGDGSDLALVPVAGGPMTFLTTGGPSEQCPVFVAPARARR